MSVSNIHAEHKGRLVGSKLKGTSVYMIPRGFRGDYFIVRITKRCLLLQIIDL